MKKTVVIFTTLILWTGFASCGKNTKSTEANNVTISKDEAITSTPETEEPIPEETVPELTFHGKYKCGKQPKQVLFSPDGRFIVLPLLADTGFDIFSVDGEKIIKRINPPDSKKTGFAECLFIPEKNAFFVSQMTTAKIHEYSYPGFEYKRSISTKGEWSKFMVWDGNNQKIAVSNWISNDVSIIDYQTGNVDLRIKTAAAPRGLAFINKGTQIVSLAFDGGKIQKFETATGKLLKSIAIEKSAMRHIVLDSQQNFAYISDMFHREILKVDLKDFKIDSKIQVYNNPNTICLYKNRWLFVSCRGPNNPDDYTKRSLEDGWIYVIDTKDMTVANKIQGGNQPTGLDMSPDGKLLCFSNFQDGEIEIWTIDK